MNLSALLLPEGEFRVVRCDVIDKLTACGDGDSALLYLYLLRRGDRFEEKNAMRELHFSRDRYDRAVFTLTGLIVEQQSPAPDPAPSEAPKYSAAELRQARTGDHKFAAVCLTAEDVLGRTLSEAQLRSLFMIYDHLGLPAEVIIELLCYLKQEKHSLKRRDIEREACRWADMGISTAQQAQQYLARLAAEKPMMEQMLSVLHIVGREPLPAERRLVSECLEKGFPPDALALAVHRMEQHIGKPSISYLRGILNGWDQKGVHTVAEITAIEPETVKPAQTFERPSTAAPVDEGELSEWERDWLEEIRRRQQED